MHTKKTSALLKENFILTIIVLFSFFLGSCSYKFQNSHNELYFKEGVQNIYVSPIVNNSYKAGVENVVYNQLIKVLISHGRVNIVHNKADADAVLRGMVTHAAYGVLTSTTASSLTPDGLGDKLVSNQRLVATQYSAGLSCEFILIRTRDIKGKSNKIWSISLNRSKPFPASNQLGAPGTTSPLINESEFERALADLSNGMMENVHESMLAMF